MGLSLNLEKGISLNLTKEFGKLNKINLGLGWDTRMDLDAFAILLDEDGNRLNTVYFGKKSAQGVALSGDNLTGEGDGDDETIYVTLNSLSPATKKIELYANIFNAGRRTFDDVDGSFIRLINGETNEELAKYNLNEKNRNFNAIHFADLNVIDDEFVFTIVGEGLNGSITEIEREFTKKNNSALMDNSNEIVSEKKKHFWQRK